MSAALLGRKEIHVLGLDGRESMARIGMMIRMVILTGLTGWRWDSTWIRNNAKKDAKVTEKTGVVTLVNTLVTRLSLEE